LWLEASKIGSILRAEAAETEVAGSDAPRVYSGVPSFDDTPEAPAHSTVFIETYGCQMNVADTELISGVLSARGFRPVSSPREADVVLLNTCAIREHAEARVAQRVRQLIADRKRGARRVRVGLAGCMAQHHRDRLLDTIPGLDFVVGPDSYRRLPDLLESESPVADVRLDRGETYDDIAPVRGGGVRAWLTIMRGCNRFCTFCVVPYVRGRERSLHRAVLLDEARRIADAGYREIVLLGQTVNAYHDGEADFGALLRLLAEVEGIDRLRFTSPHPADMSESAVTAMRDCSKVSPYIHLPLQSGSDRMLNAMDRGHTVAEYLRLVERLRTAAPDLALSTDIIVGYPGETKDDFEATSALMEAVGFDHAFLFKYSRREGTRAFRLEETVSEDEKGERLQRLIAEQETRAAAINRRAIGRSTEVLVESRAKRQAGWLAGKNPQFKTVVFEPSGAKIGDLVTVFVEAAGPHTLTGRQISGAARSATTGVQPSGERREIV
jgi:tRNA-2-methylthio-N6-dimethylallyladenosine synthase